MFLTRSRYNYLHSGNGCLVSEKFGKITAMRSKHRLSMLTKAVVALTVIWPFSIRADAYLERGNSFLTSTYLIEVAQDTRLSLMVRGLRNGGFETSGGSWVGFDNWYSSSWHDTRLSWITQVSRNFGVIWGLSTGERAEKYTIDPGLRLGFLLQGQPSKQSLLSLSASTMLGGRLREKTCTADYGQIGGVQTVNCRLAASVLPPSETLNYLINEKPESSVRVQFKYSY